MAKSSLVLVLVSLAFGVSSLTIPGSILPGTRAALAHTLAPSTPAPHTSLAHPLISAPPSQEPTPRHPGPATRTANPRVEVNAAATPPRRTDLAPIIAVVCLLFGVPPLLFLGLSWSCRRRRKPTPETGTDLSTWDLYRQSRFDAMAASRSRGGSSRKSSRRSRLGLGLGVGLPHGVRHTSTPRRPSPLRQVYTAAHKGAGMSSSESLVPASSESASDALPPGSDYSYARGSASPVSDVSMSPRTPESATHVETQLEYIDNSIYRTSLIGKDAVNGHGKEQDIADAYGAYFVLGEDDDYEDDSLVGIAHWYISRQAL